jgi:murein DD-endopeptidase MepM/ murein hydrolase activator NlpD
MFKLKKIQRYSIIFVPEQTSKEPRSIVVSSRRIIIYLAVYSLILAVLGFYIISFTPLGTFIFPYSLRLTESDKEKVEVLNEKIIYLAKEMEELKSTNYRLKKAIMLGDSTVIDNPEIKLNTGKNNSLYQNNIYAIVLNLFKNFFSKQDESISFIKPSDGFISKAYSPENGHYGIDYVMKENSPVYASAGGYIVFSSYTTENGYSIVINHTDNYVTKYLHCSLLLKKEGDVIYQGELIALSGNSGTASNGPHLHFEIWKDGKIINPSDVLIKY